MARHALRLDGVCSCANDAVSAVHTLQQAADAFAAVGTACAAKEFVSGSGSGREGREEGEEREFGLHFDRQCTEVAVEFAFWGAVGRRVDDMDEL